MEKTEQAGIYKDGSKLTEGQRRGLKTDLMGMIQEKKINKEIIGDAISVLFEKHEEPMVDIYGDSENGVLPDVNSDLYRLWQKGWKSEDLVEFYERGHAMVTSLQESDGDEEKIRTELLDEFL